MNASRFAYAYLLMLGAHVLCASIRHVRAAAGDDQPKLRALAIFLPPFFVLCFGSAKQLHDRWGILSAYAQSLLFLMAFVYACREGAVTRSLASPVAIAAGLAAGHALFGLSLLATHQSLRDTASHLVDFGSLWEFAVENPSVLLQFATVGIAEEVVYRAAAQPLLVEIVGSPAVALSAVAIAFCCVHDHFHRNPARQRIEFFAFAVLLGALYWWTASLILVIVVHAVRNIEIAYLEYAIRTEELGGEEAADRETELLGGRRLLVLVAAPASGANTACLEYVRDAEPRPQTAS